MLCLGSPAVRCQRDRQGTCHSLLGVLSFMIQVVIASIMRRIRDQCEDLYLIETESIAVTSCHDIRASKPLFSLSLYPDLFIFTFTISPAHLHLPPHLLSQILINTPSKLHLHRQTHSGDHEIGQLLLTHQILLDPHE